MVKPLVLSGRSRRKLLGASLALALPTALAISGGTLASAASAAQCPACCLARRARV